MSYITWNWVISRRFSRINEAVFILNEKKNHDFIRLSVCMLVSIISAFLLARSLYVKSPTTTSLIVPFLFFLCRLLWTLWSWVFSSFLIIRYHESANDAGLREGKIVYNLNTVIALYGTLLHSVIVGKCNEYISINLYSWFNKDCFEHLE